MADVKKEIINQIALNVLNIGSVGDTTVEMTSELKYRIAKDITVNTAINSLIRGVTSRELIVKSEMTMLMKTMQKYLKFRRESTR